MYRPKTGEIASDNNCARRATDHQFVNFIWSDKNGTKTKFENYKGCMDDSGKKLNQIVEQLSVNLGIAEFIKGQGQIPWLNRSSYKKRLNF